MARRDLVCIDITSPEGKAKALRLVTDEQWRIYSSSDKRIRFYQLKQYPNRAGYKPPLEA